MPTIRPHASMGHLYSSYIWQGLWLRMDNKKNGVTMRCRCSIIALSGLWLHVVMVINEHL